MQISSSIMVPWLSNLTILHLTFKSSQIEILNYVNLLLTDTGKINRCDKVG